jgi:hypothetical protein
MMRSSTLSTMTTQRTTRSATTAEVRRCIEYAGHGQRRRQRAAKHGSRGTESVGRRCEQDGVHVYDAWAARCVLAHGPPAAPNTWPPRSGDRDQRHGRLDRDAKQAKVFRYTNAAGRLSGTRVPSSFSLNKNNKNPKASWQAHAPVGRRRQLDRQGLQVHALRLACGSWTVSTIGARARPGSR